MQLNKLQTQFFDAVFNNNVDEKLFKSTPELLPQRLAIYRDSMAGMRHAALSKTFSGCKKIVGEHYWQLLIEEFSSRNFSHDVDIAANNRAFVEFIATHSVLKHVPYLADLAQTEWAWQQCFHQSSLFQSTQTLAQAIEQQGEQLLLILAPGVQMIESIYPLETLWLFCHQQSSESLLLDDLRSKRYFILYRERDRIIIKQVLHSLWQIGQLLLAREYSILDLCTEHQQCYNDTLNTEALQELVQHGIINWRL